MAQRTLMVVHAHPDDEVFSTGGLIAKHAAAGDRVVLVYGTRGEAGEMHDETRDPEEAKRRLGEIREQEVRAAARLLGVDELHFLGYRDSGMKDTKENQNPAAFMNASLDEAADRLMTLMQETQPQVVVTYNEDGGYGHPDHVMTHRVTVEAFDRAQAQPWVPRKLYFTAGSRSGFRRYVEGLREHGLTLPWLQEDTDLDQIGMPDEEITAWIDIAPFAQLKKQALAVHRTQIKPDFFYLSIPDEVIADVSGTEYFRRARPPHETGEREHDLFAGLEADEAAA